MQHEVRAHSTLGASAAHRWMACPGSVRLAAGMPERMSIYAAEGTAAHELAEKCLSPGANRRDAADYIGETITVGQFSFEVDEAFAEAVQVYLDTVRSYLTDPGDTLSIEERFDLSPHVMDGMFGTADAVIWKPAERRLVVVDLKFGKGYAVEIADNKQLRYYALGALLKGNYPAREVEVVVVQPRAAHKDGPVRSETTDVLSLFDFQDELRTAALLTLDPDAPLKPGPWCRFCPREATCEARREQSLLDARREFAETPIREVAADELSEILAKAGEIESWIGAVKREAYRRLALGLPVAGWKLVAKRAIRKWQDDPFTLGQELARKFELDEDDVYEPRELKSPAQLEKLIPRARRPELADHYARISSGTTLAVEADRRPAVLASRDATADFEEVLDD